ncbi:UDP-galactopyranose mutase [Curtobacterium sp. SGAir0471]|nr:UDP-galactopyranose mutase [Curtobacterium sp. SGAir0471]
MSCDVLVVGAGLYGLTAAVALARTGRNVAVIDKRDHVGGNAYSYRDKESGIEIHKYGSHIFHTSNERVWKFVSRYARMDRYEHRVFTRHAGRVYPMPISLATINQLYEASFSPHEARVQIKKDTEPYQSAVADSLEAKALAAIGPRLYDALIKSYTQKQWQTKPSELPADVITRLPVRYNYDTRYFSDKYQGLPIDGYGVMAERMASEEGVEVHLSEDFFDVRSSFSKGKTVGRIPVIYTGALDRYFDYSAGSLSWRTLDFEWHRFDVSDYQGTAVVNYADLDVPFTRSHEFKHYSPERHGQVEQTVVAHELSRFASPDDEPYYPVNSILDRERLRSYRTLASKERGVVFGGRLGSYKYLDMHMAIAAALHDVEFHFGAD